MEKLLNILWELHPDVDFTTAEDLIQGGVLDSFDIVTIVSEVDDQFDVLICASELVPENFYSAQTLYALIRRLQN